MTGAEVAVFAAKLVFGTLAFLIIGYLGNATDKRVAGTMLTFPVLNGIGLVASPDKDPAALTAAMMPMIVLNAGLCFTFIMAFRWARQRAEAASDRTLSYGVGIAGAAIWFVVAALLVPSFEAALPSSLWIALIYLAATAVLTPLLWSARPEAASRPAPAPAAPDVWADFLTFWRMRAARFAFFLVSLFALLIATHIGDVAWVGKLSALPLVPLCVLAGLAIDEPDGLPALRDPILIGPGLAMLFVLPFTAILSGLDGSSGLRYWALGTAALMAGWTLCILAIRFAVPPLARKLDRLERS